LKGFTEFVKRGSCCAAEGEENFLTNQRKRIDAIPSSAASIRSKKKRKRRRKRDHHKRETDATVERSTTKKPD